MTDHLNGGRFGARDLRCYASDGISPRYCAKMSEGWPPLMLERSSRASRFLAFDTCQAPPRRVRMPRAFISVAIPRSEVCPAARISAITGPRAGIEATPDNVPEDAASGTRLSCVPTAGTYPEHSDCH